MNEWQHRLARLADELGRAGRLPGTWSEAFRSVPRHVLVPRYYEQDDTGQWRAIDGTDPTNADRWLDNVYSDRTLITALQEDRGPWGIQHIPISSSTLPGLMLRMLDELRVTDASIVLEIGTGSGYNAALLSARLGADHIYSTELRDELVTVARERLAGIGHRPALATGDGADGLPEFGPYDRIIATCAERYIPPAWLVQLAPDGIIIADIKGGLSAGNLVRLRRHPTRPLASGRFLPWWAGFMTMVHTDSQIPGKIPERRPVEARTSTLAPTILQDPVFAFLAQAHLPADIQLRRRRDAGHCSTVLVEAGNGAWTAISHHDGNLGHSVEHTGTDHWQLVETAHALWDAAGRPGWERFGLTVTAEAQYLWLDDPSGAHIWPLHPPAH